MKTATVHIQVERTLESATKALIPELTTHYSGITAILPSTLDNRDLVAEAVIHALPPDSEPEIITPLRGGEARKALVLPAAFGQWRDVQMSVPGARIGSVQLPGKLVNAPSRIITTDVVEVARHGPFVLDLPARYAHPRQRLRLVTDRERSSLMAEVAAALPIHLAVVCLMLPEGAFLAATTDCIAAELVALALSERCLGTVREFSGPWEDTVVQRATELELGVLLPSRIRILAAGRSAREPWADALQEYIRRRLGIPGTSSLHL